MFHLQYFLLLTKLSHCCSLPHISQYFLVIATALALTNARSDLLYCANFESFEVYLTLPYTTNYVRRVLYIWQEFITIWIIAFDFYKFLFYVCLLLA